MTQETIQVSPKEPVGRKWKPLVVPKRAKTEFEKLGILETVWWACPSEDLMVGSEVATTKRGLEWHLTISRMASDKRPGERAIKRVRKAFRMEEAEEDNHGAQMMRALWLPVDSEKREPCECSNTP